MRESPVHIFSVLPRSQGHCGVAGGGGEEERRGEKLWAAHITLQATAGRACVELLLRVTLLQSMTVAGHTEHGLLGCMRKREREREREEGNSVEQKRSTVKKSCAHRKI